MLLFYRCNLFLAVLFRLDAVSYGHSDVFFYGHSDPRMVGCDKSKLSALWRNPFTDASTGGRSKGKQHQNHNAMESDFKTKLIHKEQRKNLTFGHLTNKQNK